MKHFLELVANDLRAKSGNDLSRTIVIFPNKRACLFLNNYLLSDAQPVWAPQYMTISEFFTSMVKIDVADPIETVIRLYKHYCELTGSNESIDFFYGWGERILADFDDIDKNLGNAEEIFNSLGDYERICAEDEFLTEEQIKQLGQFVKDVTEENRSEVRSRFLKLWDELPKLYDRLRAELAECKQAYEGQLYRHVVEEWKEGNIHLPENVDRIAFVGFNVLDKVEEELFTLLKNAGKAVFYWDYDTHYLQSGMGVPTEAGLFLKENLEKFPNELSNESDFDNLTNRQDGEKLSITYAMADTNAIQAQYVKTWLNDKQHFDEVQAHRTAIVLCDETMLQPVLHALPNEEGYKVNITKGYPLSHTPAYTFIVRKMDEFLAERRNADLHRTEQGEEQPKLTAVEIAETLTKLQKLVEDETIKAKNSTEENSWNRILYTESYFQVYTVLTRFIHLVEQGELIDADKNAVIQLHTLFKLVRQVMRSVTIPFHGEPAEGLQVMGVLETRCIDFDNVLLLSVDDGTLPQKASDASFIPYLLRKHYGLTTSAKRTAVFAYYFYRLLQRAKHATLVYNGSTSGTKKGEMSRFMKQMLVNPKLSDCIKQVHLASNPVPKQLATEFDTKSPWRDKPDMVKFSPSALNTYIQCKLKFFFKYIKGFEVTQESDNTIDPRDLGTVFHGTAELIYEKELSNATPAQIAHFLETSGDAALTQYIRQAITDANDNSKQKRKIKWGVLLESTVLHLIKQLLRYEANADNVKETKICANEHKAETTLKVPYGKGGNTLDIKIYGSIDRLDVQKTADNKLALRIIDYKTGGSPHEVADKEKLFPEETSNKIADYAYIRQTFMYALMMLDHPFNKETAELPIRPLLYYINSMGNKEFSPGINVDEKEVANFQQFADWFREKLTKVIAELISPENDFNAEYNNEKCKFCDYAELCRSRPKS